PFTICRTQATTVSPAFARAGSCARPDRRNVGTEPPYPLLPLRLRRGIPSNELWSARSRALAAPWRNWGCSGILGPTNRRASRTKQNPTSVPRALSRLLSTPPPVSSMAGRRSRWVTNTAEALEQGLACERDIRALLGRLGS